MFERRSLRWPITLGVLLFVTLVVLIVGWVLLSVYGLLLFEGAAPLYWTLLTVGSTLFVLVIVGVAMYLALSVKAIKLSERQSNFVDSVTHELKSPIASLKLYLQTLNRRTVSPEEQVKFFRFMLEDVERLDRLINHLLVTGRLQRGVSTDEVDDIELEPLLRQCIREVADRYSAGDETYRMKLEPSIVTARRVDLDMIFRNLVDNAFKYAGDPPRIEVISFPRPDGRVVTQVIDNGRGIPQRSRQSVFGRFVRLGSELERDKPGTGLGLYIVETLVRSLRGTVRVREPVEGPGALFEVILPGRTHEVAHPASRPASNPAVTSKE
ncbi:MAG: sensor histidine kinase [Pirellulaceae bacterium]